MSICGDDETLLWLKFMPGEWLFQVWKQKSRTGQTWQIKWMEQQFVAMLDQLKWKSLFSSRNEAVFSGIRCQIKPVIMHSTALYPFSLFQVFGVYQWIHVSLRVTKRRRNFFRLRSNSVKHCFEVTSRLWLLSEVSKLSAINLTASLCPTFPAGYDTRNL